MTQRRGAHDNDESAVEPRLREILGGAAVFRLLTVAWAFTVTVIDARSGVLDHRLVAFAVLAVLLAWTARIGLWAQNDAQMLLRGRVIAVDMAMAVALVIGDSVVYAGPHPQSFGSAWPVIALVSTATILGWQAGLVAGASLGIIDIAASALGGRIDGNLLSLVGSLFLLTAMGSLAGYISVRLREADTEIADGRARDGFARTLHDGVLQTLAVIQRRSDDHSLVDLAREQEWELRDFISNGVRNDLDLTSALRHAASRAERRFDVRVDLVVVDAPKEPTPATTAMVAAAAEAMTNAAKHGAATVLTVFVDLDPSDGVVVTVNDDGCGFDTGATEEGTGISQSIRGRLDEVGGTAAIRSWPGRGTEVALWIPGAGFTARRLIDEYRDTNRDR